MAAPQNAEASRKVLLVGWDAADWKVISPLIDAGKMPHLERLINGGVAGNLATLYPVLSPMLWTSIATGKRAFKHGIHGFAEPASDGKEIRPISNVSRKTKAIWNILNQNDLVPNVVGWWPSQPVEPINGVMISDLYYRATGPINEDWPLPPSTVHPERLSEGLREFRVHPQEILAEDLLPFVPNAESVDQSTDKRLGTLAKLIAECSSVHAAATAVMQLESWDFMAVYYDAIDHFSHAFMRYHPPRQEWITEDDFKLYSGVIEGAYRLQDLMLGTLLSLAGNNVTTIVMSDHGFHPDHLRPASVPNEPAGPAAEHRSQGIIVINGPGIRRDELIFGSTLLDITPTILSLFGLPIGRDMDGKVLTQAFESEPGVSYIDSWEMVEGNSGMHSEGSRHDFVQSQEALDQLVALGYIAEPGEDQRTATKNTVQELRYNLARSYVGAHWHEPAIKIFRELWDAAPTETRFGIHLFQSLLTKKRITEAGEVFAEILTSKKAAVEQAAKDLADLEESREGKRPEDFSDKENRTYNKLRRKATTNTDTLAFLRGSLLQAEGRYDEAISKLKQASKAQTYYQPALHEKLGEAYLGKKDWNLAEQSYTRSLEIDSVNSRAHLGLARSYLGRGQLLRASASIKESVGLDFQNPQAHYISGLIYRRMKRYHDAVASLEIAVQQNPVFPKAHEQLAEIYGRELKDFDKQRLHTKAQGNTEDLLSEIRAGKEISNSSKQESWAQLFGANEEDRPSKLDGTAVEDSIIVVSGLPRSGTSLMMQMLDAGGLDVLTDGKREADKNNPNGYYEFERTINMGQDNSWLADCHGQCIKIIAQLLPTIPKNLPYRIILMQRDLGAVTASQTRMLEQMGKTSSGTKLSENELAEVYSSQLRSILGTIGEFPMLDLLRVNYDELVDSPATQLARINQFLLGRIDETNAITMVDPHLRNHRPAPSK